MRVNGQDMNLRQYVKFRKATYSRIHKSWMWDEEGIVWAVQDYESSVPYADWSEEDKKYLEEINLTELFNAEDIEDVDEEECLTEDDLYAKVFCNCDMETVIDNALEFIPEEQHRVFLLACLGHDID